MSTGPSAGRWSRPLLPNPPSGVGHMSHLATCVSTSHIWPGHEADGALLSLSPTGSLRTNIAACFCGKARTVEGSLYLGTRPCPFWTSTSANISRTHLAGLVISVLVNRFKGHCGWTATVRRRGDRMAHPYGPNMCLRLDVLCNPKAAQRVRGCCQHSAARS
jgi:hypothetical protein